MNEAILKTTMASATCLALALSVQSALADKYEIVSNSTNAVFASAGSALQSTGSKPIDKIFSGLSTAAFAGGAHSGEYTALNYVSTNKCLGSWLGVSQMGMLVREIDVTESSVMLTVEERFLIYTNASDRVVNYGAAYCRDATYKTIFTDNQSVCVDQECEPPTPWTTHGYAPYCRDEMTNRTEVIDCFEGVTREVVGYYDADGDGYATLSRVGVVHGSSGDYLDELAEGSYWIVNDVLVTRYTIPRNSYLNFVYGTEDAQNHYWYAIKSLYRIVLETTPLKPWWQMPEYQ